MTLGQDCRIGRIEGGGGIVNTVVYEISVKLRIETKRDGSRWLACCPTIDVMTQERTKSSAVECLREAVELWFESCIARQVLHEALEECGFAKNESTTGLTGDTVQIRTRISPSTDDKRLFSVAHHKGMSCIDGFIPAYIASQQLGDASLARG